MADADLATPEDLQLLIVHLDRMSADHARRKQPDLLQVADRTLTFPP
jgi:hypothetical protein